MNKISSLVKEKIDSLLSKVKIVEEKIKLESLLSKVKRVDEKIEKKVETGKGLLFKLFFAFIATFLIFFPFVIQQIATTYLILFIIILVILIIIIVFAKVFPGTDVIVNIVFCIIFFAILLILSSSLNCGSQACFWIISARFGTLGAVATFFIVLTFYLTLIPMIKDWKIYIVVITVITSILMFILIPLLSPANYYKFCKQIPFMYGTSICKPREVKVDPIKTVKIPVAGGITVRIETPSTLYGGNPYEFTFVITNLYDRDINFLIKPSIVSYYGSNIEFIQPFNQKISSLKPREFYQDVVFLNPNEMYTGKGTCPYTTDQISIATGLPEDKVPCSRGKPCENPKASCTKLDVFQCACVDWNLATCSRNPLKVKMNIKHTGFFLGNSSLYYSEKIVNPVRATELIQGPLRVIIEFIPNPYVATIHGYREDVSMFVTFQNFGGEIRLNNFKVLPQKTVIHTIDKEKEIELLEEVGTEVISCRSLEEILPGTLKSGSEIGGKLCTLKPPFVKTTLIDLRNKEVIEVNNVTYSFINNYCYKVKPNITERGYVFWSTNWDKIYETVSESGLCELLKKENVKEREIVKESLSYVHVLLELEYEREIDFYSGEIVPYTRTEECMKVEEIQ